MENILYNSWTITIAGGFIVLILGKFFIDRRSKISEKPEVTAVNSGNQNQNLTVNNYNLPQESLQKIRKDDFNLIKNNTRVLFVDDDTTFKIVDILKDAGWVNTRIVEDIKDIDSLDIRNTDIFFIDIKGVGSWLSVKDEGLALAEKLKDHYPNKKIVIYSSDKKGDRSHRALQKVDWFLDKYAEPTQFYDVLERLTKDGK